MYINTYNEMIYSILKFTVMLSIIRKKVCCFFLGMVKLSNNFRIPLVFLWFISNKKCQNDEEFFNSVV